MEPPSKPPRDGFKVQVLLGTLSLSSHHVHNTLSLLQEMGKVIRGYGRTVLFVVKCNVEEKKENIR
jgi:hypothetical protein